MQEGYANAQTRAHILPVLMPAVRNLVLNILPQEPIKRCRVYDLAAIIQQLYPSSVNTPKQETRPARQKRAPVPTWKPARVSGTDWFAETTRYYANSGLDGDKVLDKPLPLYAARQRAITEWRR